jgi:tetratricopeptide (TPR) repeat protein
VFSLGFPEDGRAYAVLDLDGDGDLDLLQKNRNAPQLRILRNDVPTTNHSIGFRLTGRKSNRDATGAVVTIEADGGRQTRQLAIGSGFLSQSSRLLVFGLGAADKVLRATVRWPSGLEQTFTDLPADHHIAIVEGESKITSTPFGLRNADPRACAPQKPVPPGTPPQGIALLQAVPSPAFELENLAGKKVRSASLTGRPMLLNFWATWCAPCQKELAGWTQEYERLRAAGLDIVAVSVDDAADRAQVEQYARERGLPFTILLADRETIERYNTFYRFLVERTGDMEIPTSMLLNARGEVAKLYRGVVPMEVLQADLAALQSDPAQLARTALPYGGRLLAGGFVRDYARLGGTYFEQDRLADSVFYLQKAVETIPSDFEAWGNLGVVWARQGQTQRALEAFAKAVEIRPDYSDGHFNLGIAHSQSGRAQEALGEFARAAALDPADGEKALRYAAALAEAGQLQEAAGAIEAYLETNPNDAEAENQLGVVLARAGSTARAMERFQRAAELKPDFGDAFRNLGLAYLEQAMLFRASEALERALALNPSDAEAALALAEAYLKRGLREQGEKMLERVLELRPDDERARHALEQLRHGASRR